MISTDQIRFSTSVNLAILSTEVVNPDFSILMSDELFNSQVFSGSLTAQIDTILPQLSTPISFSTDPISDTTYIGQGSSILIDFELSKVEDSVEIYFDSNSVVTFSNVSTWTI